MHRDWAPLGADRFYNLVKNGFYDDVPVLPRARRLHGAVRHERRSGDPDASGAARIQGRSGEAEQQARLRHVREGAAPNSRTTQVFINYVDNSRLDAEGFAPFGQVVQGMDVVDKLYSGYGRMNVPDQGRITEDRQRVSLARNTRSWTTS